MKFARTALTQIATYTALICMAGSAQAALNKFADWGPLQPTQSPPVLVVPVSTISLPCKLGCSLGPQLNLNGVGSIGYSLSSSNLSTDAANAPSGLHVFPVVSDVEVSTLWYADTLTFNKFTSNIRAVGFNLSESRESRSRQATGQHKQPCAGLGDS